MIRAWRDRHGEVLIEREPGSDRLVKRNAAWVSRANADRLDGPLEELMTVAELRQDPAHDFMAVLPDRSVGVQATELFVVEDDFGVSIGAFANKTALLRALADRYPGDTWQQMVDLGITVVSFSGFDGTSVGLGELFTERPVHRIEHDHYHVHEGQGHEHGHEHLRGSESHEHEHAELPSAAEAVE
jgi:hypothetical protein